MSVLVTVVPTLARMAAVYALSRDGGPTSPRFREYRTMAHEWGFSAWNPMAGDHAADATAALLALDAEALVRSAAQDVAERLGLTAPIVLAVAVLSPGLWTDRLATEVERTLGPHRTAHYGLVATWTREPVTADDLVRLTRAEVARIAWASLHGDASTLVAVLEREGLARAIADGRPALQEQPWGDVAAIVRVHAGARGLDAIAPVAYGDAVATQMGWAPHGLPERAGLRWAAAHARVLVHADGAAAAVRRTGWLPETSGA